MKKLAVEKAKYFKMLTNENMLKYKKYANLEKLYDEMKIYKYTFYMSLKEKMAR
jgi:hypothetical protein